MISPTQAERNAILRSYFEPSDEEREQQLMVPTAAHKAIAYLVKDGYMKLIITINFDCLLELALEGYDLPQQSVPPTKLELPVLRLPPFRYQLQC